MVQSTARRVWTRICSVAIGQKLVNAKVSRNLWKYSANDHAINADIRIRYSISIYIYLLRFSIGQKVKTDINIGYVFIIDLFKSAKSGHQKIILIIRTFYFSPRCLPLYSMAELCAPSTNICLHPIELPTCELCQKRVSKWKGNTSWVPTRLLMMPSNVIWDKEWL